MRQGLNAEWRLDTILEFDAIIFNVNCKERRNNVKSFLSELLMNYKLHWKAASKIAFVCSHLSSSKEYSANQASAELESSNTFDPKT